ncbi:hypothetical protein [Actinopolymorpha pittospori]|uniref:Lipopolysaccharide assembly protein A domain-containing protein n=1 Tax=Actinopolymorpha pittospori TaxID=648752 RepID=A0A927N773_9ACTN|nr:hypothetical protein [Actinopolymorpha pittospori]MBE1612263.1 hypothetical protein [Actinopolymorpha pittospori]
MFFLGLILFVAAAVVGVVGTAANQGADATLASNFTLFGWPVPMSSGWVFFWGVITGLVGMLGLAMMARAAYRARAHRRELRHTRREADELRKREAQRMERLEGERSGSAKPGTSGEVPGQRAEAEHPTGFRDRLGLRHRTHK